MQYLSVQASSRPVKQLFSVTENIYCPERRPLTDTVIENLMFIKFSSYILDLH